MSTFSKSLSSTSSDEDAELRRGPWTVEEDTLLIHYIARHGEGRWNLLAKRSGLRRNGKSCRLRWLNYLKPDVKRGNLTPQEQLLILELHSKWGNRWSKIAQQLPGRTDNEIKNYWRTRVQKQARHLKIDSNSTAFQELIRSFWMPRLVEKIQGTSPPSAALSQNSDAIRGSEHALLAPQVPANGPVIVGETTMQSMDHHLKNSSSEQCTSPSISSSESMNMSNLTQASEHQASIPFHALDSTDYNPFLKECYSVDNTGYDMESFNLGSVSAMSGFEDPTGDFHMRETNWIDYDLADSLWNMDELWQFRQLQEKNCT